MYCIFLINLVVETPIMVKPFKKYRKANFLIFDWKLYVHSQKQVLRTNNLEKIFNAKNLLPPKHSLFLCFMEYSSQEKCAVLEWKQFNKQHFTVIIPIALCIFGDVITFQYVTS